MQDDDLFQGQNRLTCYQTAQGPGVFLFMGSVPQTGLSISKTGQGTNFKVSPETSQIY